MSPALRSIGRLTWTGFLQLLRTRVYLNILVAGMFLVGASLLFDELSGGAGGRVLLDIGVGFTAIVVAALAGVLAITALTRDLETKQAHLVLSRPVARWHFIVARFLTTALLIVVANLVLGGLLAILLLASGAPHAGIALAACLFASLEGFILAAIAIFFGTGSSSTMSAVFTTTLFLLGRLTGEMAIVIERGSLGAATPVLQVGYAVLPHLPAFDLTPLAHGSGPSPAELATTALYGIAYAGAFLAAATFRFSRRDLL
jgi:ABC-type transport system involved in multi-copper enzyme maturation permease subunit